MATFTEKFEHFVKYSGKWNQKKIGNTEAYLVFTPSGRVGIRIGANKKAKCWIFGSKKATQVAELFSYKDFKAMLKAMDKHNKQFDDKKAKAETPKKQEQYDF